MEEASRSIRGIAFDRQASLRILPAGGAQLHCYGSELVLVSFGGVGRSRYPFASPCVLLVDRCFFYWELRYAKSQAVRVSLPLLLYVCCCSLTQVFPANKASLPQSRVVRMRKEGTQAWLPKVDAWTSEMPANCTAPATWRQFNVHSIQVISGYNITPTLANMVLKLRLARPATPGGSRKHHPRYNIVLAHAR